MNNPIKYYREMGERYLGNASVEADHAQREIQFERAFDSYLKLAEHDRSPEVAEMLYELRECRREPELSRDCVGSVMDRHGIGTKSLSLVR